MYVDTKETAFLHDLTKPSLEALSHVLRHKEMWPEGFEWDYNWCMRCAMGLAGQLWRVVTSDHVGDALAEARDAFDMPHEAARKIFVNREWLNRDGDLVVTPDMVADEIDKYLASRKG